MSIKKVLALLLALVLTFTFAACGEKPDDGETGPNSGSSEPAVKTADCTFTAQTDDGSVVSGLLFALELDGEFYSLVTGDDGTVKATLPVGTYHITYDDTTVPSGCTADLFEIEVRESSTAYTLAFTDNTPDGSAEKPFFIADSMTSISLDAGQELHYIYRGAGNKYIQINADGISITHEGAVFTSVDGVVQAQLQTQIGKAATFSVKNTSETKIETVMELVSPLGSMENPIVLTENIATAVVPADGFVCYQWTSDKDGVVVVSSGHEMNNISMVNMTTNAVSAQTGGSFCEYLSVSVGDTVVITVSSLAAGTETSINFTVASYLGTDAEAIPVLKDSVDLSLKASASLTFTAEAGKTLTVNDENATVTFGGKTYESDEFGVISITFGGNNGERAIFTVTNTSENVNGIQFTVE